MKLGYHTLSRIKATNLLLLWVLTYAFCLSACSLNRKKNQIVSMVWKAGNEVSVEEALAMDGVRAFVSMEIPEEVKERMKGRSFPIEGEILVTFDDLRYLKLLHYTLDGKIKMGEMVVNKDISDDVIDIFHELFLNKYPIERVQLIDDFGAVDEMSMRMNNSSSFCYRVVSGTTRLSKHALGRAVDINTLYNPFYRLIIDENGDSIGYRDLQPETAVPYVNRESEFPYKIDGNDLAVKLFKKKGFVWGGDWIDRKDFQHFEK